MKDYYTILGVTKASSEDEIRKRYRKLAMQYHPDQNPDTPGAEEKFKEIAEAYGVLTDPVKRQEYDILRRRADSGFQGGTENRDFSYSQEDILRDLFNDPRFQQMFNGLLHEFQRSGFRSNSEFVKRSFFGGKGGLFMGGLFFFGSMAGPALFKSAKNKKLTEKSSMFKTIGRTLGNLLDSKQKQNQSHILGENITYDTILTPLEMQQGKMIQVVLHGGEKKETLRVKVPPGSKSGQKLRVKGKGSAGPNGRGDLFLRLAQK